MNTLKSQLGKSKYCDLEHFLLLLDEKPIDIYLHEKNPKLDLEGMIPAFLDWVEDEAEKKVIWERAFPTEGRKSMSPILVCPEDLDLWGHVIIAETSIDANTVHWHRLGIDFTEEIKNMPEAIGTTVRWFKNVGPFSFDKKAYIECLKNMSRK